MKFDFFRQIFEKCSNIKFHENPFSGCRVVPCRRTDMLKLIVAFRNFANLNNIEMSKKAISISSDKYAVLTRSSNLAD